MGDFVKKNISSVRPIKIPLTWKLILLVVVLLWIPLMFIGFDSHHDGLILTTVNMLHDSIRNQGQWPFNQYGPFWAMPYVLFTYALPEPLVFTALRVITVGFYLLTGFLIYQCAKLISSTRIAFFSALIYFLSQPFVSDYGSDLVPWPSAVIMPMVMLVVLLFLRMSVATETSRQVKYYSYLIGLIVSGILFSRAQIGILLFVSFIFLFFLQRNQVTAKFFLLGFVSFTLIFFAFLKYFGWLSDAINDEFIFGSLYLRGDTSTYPNPIFTFVGTASFFIILYFGKRVLFFIIERNLLKQLIVVLSGLLSLIVTASYLILNSRDIDSIAMVSTFSRRAWISYYLAVIVYSVFEQSKKVLATYKSSISRDSTFSNRNALVLFSVVGELQIYPLFDQMHFWWGSVPAVILVVIVTKEILIDPISSLNVNNKLANAFLVLTTLLCLIQISGQLAKPYSRYPQEIVKYLWVSPSVSEKQEQLQRFFDTNIPKGSSVLNLCANSDVFFSDVDVRSSSRIFVLWPNITEVANMKQSMISSTPDIVLTCSLSRIASLQENAELEQQEILFKSIKNPEVFATLNFSHKTTWQLWRTQ
jgi:hypothetical protein